MIRDRREYRKAYYANNKEAALEYNRKYTEENSEYVQEYKHKYYMRNTTKYMWYSARRRAQLQNVPFEISIDDLTIPEVCPVLGIPLIGGERKQHDNSPTLDRLIPKLGYVRNNISIISFRANRIKNNATIEDLELILKWMKEQHVQET